MKSIDTLIQQKREQIKKIIHLHFNAKHSGATNDTLDEIESTIREVAGMVATEALAPFESAPEDMEFEELAQCTKKMIAVLTTAKEKGFIH